MILINFIVALMIGLYSITIGHHKLEIAYHEPTLQKVSEKDLKCLADNLYHEARSEGIMGMAAVAYVTINRLAHRKYPGSVCGVVHQPYQFSWTNVKHSLKVTETNSYQQAMVVAKHVLQFGNAFDITQGSIFFHVKSMKRPKWTRDLIVVAVIGNHVFYKEKHLT